MKENLVQPQRSSPLVDEGREFWRDVGKELIRNSAETLDNVAKQIIAVAGIMIGLYYNGIAAVDVKIYTKDNFIQTLFYSIPIIFFTMSVACALLVFFPDRLRVNLFSSDSAKAAFEAIIKSKLLLVRVSAIAFIAGAMALVIVVFAYLYHH